MGLVEPASAGMDRHSRAMPIRCCWPPDNLERYWSALSKEANLGDQLPGDGLRLQEFFMPLAATRGSITHFQGGFVLEQVWQL